MSKFTETVPKYMAQFMRDFDVNVIDAAAVFGNAGHESGGLEKLQEISPTVKGSRGGFGWYQWTGPRRRAYEAYCKRNGLDPRSDDANYAFLFVELKGSEKRAIPELKAAVGLRNKVIAFEMAYERAGVKHYESRIKWAEQALSAYDARRTAPVDTTPVASPPPAVPTSVSTPVAVAGGGGIVAVLLAIVQFFFG